MRTFITENKDNEGNDIYIEAKNWKEAEKIAKLHNVKILGRLEKTIEIDNFKLN